MKDRNRKTGNKEARKRKGSGKKRLAAGGRLSEELCKYGYVFDMRKSFVRYGVAAAASFLLGWYFSLGGWYLLALCVWVCLLLPFFLRNLYKNRYEQQRFSDVNIYMEQFLYSFQKSGKILTTLEDVTQLFEEGRMRDTLLLAREHILHTYEEEQVELQALEIIEEAYPASQIRMMHRFALQVEKNGGEYGQPVLLMLETRRMWADRIYELLNERKRQRMGVFLSIATSLLLCSLISMLAGSLNIPVEQVALTKVVTLAVLMIDFYIFYRADRKLSAEFLREEDGDEKDVLRQYRILMEKPGRGPVAAMQRRIAAKNVTRAIEKHFPQWLMQVSLLLQSENVQVAMFKSYEDAPAVLKPALREFLEELREKPASMEPYLHFLGAFTLPEVRSSMKMLYSLSEGTGGDASFQIADIIRRNQLMMDKAQKMKNEDSLAGMYALFLAPQLTGGGKIIVDMLVLMVLYLGQYAPGI